MPLLLVHLRPQPAEVLRLGGGMVGFAGGAFAGALFVVESLSVLLLEAFDVFVLRHCEDRLRRWTM